MNIINKVASVFSEKVLAPKAENFTAQFIDDHVVDPRIEREISDYILGKYGNEPFYEDISAYFIRNHTIKGLILAVREKTTTPVDSKEVFVSDNIKKFIRLYPSYKQDAFNLSYVKQIFEYIFDYIYFKIDYINPHSNFGKLQNDIQRASSESDCRDNRNYMLEIENSKKLDKISNTLQEIKGIVDDISPELGDCSEEIDLFLGEIKDIENEYQSASLFNEALLKYFELLQTITSKLRGQPQTQIDTVLCALYCNIALCQSNLCDNEKAFGTLDLIDESAARKSKSYHFVYAAIIVNSADTFKYGIAKQSLEAALKTDPRYHRAFLLRQYLNALMNCEDSKSNIDTLDAYFSEIVAENNDLKLIADYYMNRGLILLTYDLDSPAIENFEQAIEYGYDKTIASYNKYVAVYGQAVSGLPKDARVFFPIIDYSKMNLVISGLKDIIQDDSKLAQPYLSLKRRAIALYASACSLTRSHHDLTPLKDFLPLSCDDETTRTLILGSNEELSEDLVSTLPKSDQLFVHFRQLLDNNDLVTCKEEIIQIINSSIEEMSAPLYHLLLQTCIALETPEDFWKFEKLAISSGVTGFPILSLEACAYELEGNIEKAKVAFDEIAGKSCDYCILNNTIRFYSRNKYSKECEALYLKIQTLYEDSKIYIDDIDLFYREAILFFISQRSHLADYFIGKADTSSISSNVLLMLKAKLYSTINDIPRLKDCLAILINDTNSFQNRLNLAVCQCRLMDYAASMKTCQSLLEDSTDEREQIKVYWLVSDLFLFNDDKDESFVWANKAHDLTFQNPYDQSHQAFLGRALRCGHDEALSTVLEYKKTHPVVVNWLQPVSFDFENKNPIDSLEKAVEDVFPGSNKSYIHSQEIELLYRKGSLPFNQLLKNYNNNWWKIFLYATKNKLFLSLGDRNMLQAEQALIQEHILVDAQTLIVMSYFGCLPALQSIKHIHITYGSVEELQYSYLSWDHSCLHDLMRWIETADNLEFEADDFIDDDAVLSKVFSRNFVASCNYAHANNTPYLYLDALATAIQQNPDIDLSPEIPFVSIPSIVNHYGLTHPKERNEMLYRLLTGGTFISFSPDTIVDVISANNYVITEELMQPFLICKSDYDMMSFALVYLQALFELRFLHPECADSYANIILKDAARVWRRGSFYRDAASKWASIDAQTRSSAINKYVYKLIIGIKEIMAPSISADIVVLCDELEQSLMEHLADNFAKDSLETPASFAVNTREKDCHVKWGQ